MDIKPTVYIVDDDSPILDALSTLVSSMGLLCKTFTSVESFLDGFDASLPGCVLLDIHLPNFNGLKLQEQFREKSIHVPIVIISGTTEASEAVRAMRLGAVAFLQKANHSESELCEALQTAIARDADQRAKQDRLDAIARQMAKLSDPEKEVLKRILTGKQHDEIAKELGISRRTVENRRAKLMRKLEVTTFSQLIQLANDAGFLPGN